ncbi:hypothetical protein [Streptomyces sp. NPDC001820]
MGGANGDEGDVVAAVLSEAGEELVAEGSQGFLGEGGGVLAQPG